MAGRAREGSRRRAPSDALRDLHGDIEELTQGITVTSPARAIAPPAPAPARRRRELGRMAPELREQALDGVAPAEFVLPDEPPVSAFVPRRPRQAPPIEIADDVDPLSRPWTPEAAMEPLAPASPAELAAHTGAAAATHGRSRIMTAVVLVAAAAAIFVVIASHLDLGRTSPPSFAVNDLTAAKDSADTSVTVNGHFLTTAPEIDIEAAYIGANPGDTLTIRVLFGTGVFADHVYELTAGSGSVEAPLTPKGAAIFKPGVYTIDAIWHGRAVRTAQFTVDPAPPGSPGP